MDKFTDILVSVKPEYALAILDGRKTVEFRRNLPLKNDIQKMWIYATQPVGLVLGTAYVHVWMDPHYNESDISRGLLTVEEFENYFTGARHRWFLKIKKVVPFDVPMTLKQLGISRPPQSWMYLKDMEEVRTVSEETMTKEQITVCREYLEIVELMKDWLKNMTGFSPYNEHRTEAHHRLMEVYGFSSHSDTLGVTDDIPDGMTPRELHEKLMELKRCRTTM